MLALYDAARVARLMQPRGSVEFLSWLENTDTVTWIRESTSLLGYTLYLSLHTLGLVFLLGPVVVIGLRITGLAPRLPIAPLRSFFPLMVGGFAVNLVSGLVLFATAPIGFVRNTTFLVKLGCVLLAVAAYFLAMPGLALAVSGMVALLSAGLILFETSRIVNGGETNYVMATVGLYVSVFNLFVSLLQLFGLGGGDE